MSLTEERLTNENGCSSFGITPLTLQGTSFNVFHSGHRSGHFVLGIFLDSAYGQQLRSDVLFFFFQCGGNRYRVPGTRKKNVGGNKLLSFHYFDLYSKTSKITITQPHISRIYIYGHCFPSSVSIYCGGDYRFRDNIFSYLSVKINSHKGNGFTSLSALSIGGLLRRHQ